VGKGYIPPRALGCLAEGHSRKADLPLLTLGEFSADLGGILKGERSFISKQQRLKRKFQQES